MLPNTRSHPGEYQLSTCGRIHWSGFSVGSASDHRCAPRCPYHRDMAAPDRRAIWRRTCHATLVRWCYPPVRVEDYEKDLSSAKVTFRAKPGRPSHEISEATRKELRTVVEKIESRMRQDQTQRLPKGHLWIGLLAMVALFIGAQAAMIIIEQGGVLPWWCTSRWWMHLWYCLGLYFVLLNTHKPLHQLMPSFSHQ